MPQTALLLHGFAGTGRMWDPVVARLEPERYRPLAPDLRADRGPDGLVEELARLLGEPAVVCGYSMGGRVALRLLLLHPERVLRLVLVSATAGLEHDRERRAALDEELAAWIEAHGVEAFAERWLGGELWADDPPAARALQREDILRNDAATLAVQLRRLGQGVMPPAWDVVGGIRVPVTVVAGERDRRYVALGQRLAREIPGAELVIAPGAGHGVPREAPDAIVAALG